MKTYAIYESLPNHPFSRGTERQVAQIVDEHPMRALASFLHQQGLGEHVTSITATTPHSVTVGGKVTYFVNQR